MEPINQEKPNKAIRDKKGRFVKGSSGNPFGTNAGRPPIKIIEEAIIDAEKKKSKNIWQHLIERAYKSDTVLIALLKKLLPDKIEGKGFGDLNIYALINRIQQEFISEDSKPPVELHPGNRLHQ